MFSLSPAARLLWKTRTGTAMRLHSKNRWWSKWEVLNQVMEFFGDVEPFLREIITCILFAVQACWRFLMIQLLLET